MSVCIRLARHGRTHTPFYRVVAIDNREHREGRAAEILGTYDPMLPEKNIQVDIERVHAWLDRGARYSDAVASLLKHNGYVLYTEEQQARKAAKLAKRKAKRKARKKVENKSFVKPSRRALNKHKSKLKAGRKAEAEAAAKAKAEAEAAAAPAESGDAES